jgi:hypothetical protein
LQAEPEVSLNKLDPEPLRGYIKIDRVSFSQSIAGRDQRSSTRGVYRYSRTFWEWEVYLGTVAVGVGVASCDRNF